VVGEEQFHIETVRVVDPPSLVEIRVILNLLYGRIFLEEDSDEEERPPGFVPGLRVFERCESQLACDLLAELSVVFANGMF